MLEVLSPGLLSTVQDSGRPDAAHLGVPRGGACDPRALAVVNALMGNDPGAAALEMTLVGPELRVLESCVVAVAGADLGGRVEEAGRPIPPGTAQLVRAGSTIAFRRSAVRGAGARAYLAVAGGVDVPIVLGSRSTCLVGGFGGLDGRPVRQGDRIVPLRRGSVRAAGRSWPLADEHAVVDAVPVLRLLQGPHVDRFEGSAAIVLAGSVWRVGPASDRMGIRLEGAPLPRTPGDDRELISLPMTWGALQVPPDGAPIVLLADHQTVGGYPVLGVVIAADRPLLGQLCPGDPVRFAWTTLDEAVAAARAAQRAFARAIATIARTDPWDLLSEAAEG